MNPNEITGAIIYANCHHNWRQKLRRDWIHFRRHPDTHALAYSAFYSAAKNELLKPTVDLNADNIRMRLSWNAEGIVTIVDEEKTDD